MGPTLGPLSRTYEKVNKKQWNSLEILHICVLNIFQCMCRLMHISIWFFFCVQENCLGFFIICHNKAINFDILKVQEPWRRPHSETYATKQHWCYLTSCSMLMTCNLSLAFCFSVKTGHQKTEWAPQGVIRGLNKYHWKTRWTSKQLVLLKSGSHALQTEGTYCISRTRSSVTCALCLFLWNSHRRWKYIEHFLKTEQNSFPMEWGGWHS